MTALRPERALIAVADAHLTADDPEVEVFCRFLLEQASRVEAIILLGDVFALWLGSEKLSLPHHRRVLDTCARVRGEGVRVALIEGNREYGTSPWRGRAFDETTDRFLRVPWVGKRWLFAHGDLLDVSDRGTRVFRRLARSLAVRASLRALPSRLALRLADAVERYLRHKNVARKTSAPPERFQSFLSWVAQQDCDAAAIGHVHVEMKHAQIDRRGRERSLYVLPDWRSSHKYLRLDGTGEAEFVSWGDAGLPHPAVIAVDESHGSAILVIERGIDVHAGAGVTIVSGHGDPPRRARVHSVAPVDSGAALRLRVEIEQGPAIQIGDRVDVSCAGSPDDDTT